MDMSRAVPAAKRLEVARMVAREELASAKTRPDLEAAAMRGLKMSEEGQEATSEVDTETEEIALLARCGGRVSVNPEPPATGCRGVAYAITSNEYFKMFIAVVILLNTISMAAQLDYEEFEHWRAINTAFLLTFCVEIVLRVYAEGVVIYFCHPVEWAWNVFDFVIVLAGVGDQVLMRCLDDTSEFKSFKPLMLARVLRMLRVLRVLRVLRNFKKLQMLARGLVESVVVVFWIGVLVLVMVFICAIFTTSVIGQQVQLFTAPDDQEAIMAYWGSVTKSMFTLFQFLTMDDWYAVDNLVVKKMPMMQFFFFPYIFFGAFVILSLLTGVMADHMNDVRRNEEQQEVRERVSHLETAVREVERRDEDNSGYLDRAEFFELFDPNSEFTADLREAGIYIAQEEADDLFDWFDVDGDEQIDHRDLQQGLRAMLDGLTPLQLFKLSATVRCTERLVFSCIEIAEQGGKAPWSAGESRHSPEAARRLGVLGERGTALESEFAKFETQLRDFMKKFGWKADNSLAGSHEQDVSPATSSR